MKKRFLSLVLMTVVLAGATACGQGAKKKGDSGSSVSQTTTPAEKVGLTIGKVDFNDSKLEEEWKKEPFYGKKIQLNFGGGLCGSGLGVGHAKGFFAKEGLETEIVNIPNVMDAIGTGKVIASSDHIATALVPAINGINMVFTTAVNTGCKTLFVLNESEIKTTKDLEGKEVAIHDNIGGSDHNITLRFFARDKVDIKKVKFKNVENAATIQAMQNGEVQASLFSDQFAKKFVDQGILRPIRSITFDDDFKTEPCCVLMVNKDFVEKNPITAAKLTKAYIEASAWLEDNKKEAVEIISSNNWGSGDKEKDLYFLNTYNFKISDKQTEKSLINVIEDYKVFELIDKKLETKEALAKVWRPINQK